MPSTPYVLNVVADPEAVMHQILRVCRRDARLVLLNHFDDAALQHRAGTGVAGWLATWISGVDWNVNLERLLAGTGLTVESIEAVNVPPVSCVVLCRRS